MKEVASIFFLDLCPLRGLGKKLQEILRSFSDFDIHLQESAVGVSAEACFDIEHFGVVSGFNPDIIFLILPSAHITQKTIAPIQSLCNKQSKIPIIAVVADGDPDDMVDLLKQGVADFITPPLRSMDILPRLWRLLERKRHNEVLLHSLKEKIGLKLIIGKSTALIKEIEKIPMVAKCDASVLISGETGTGKELCARAIHYLSPRAGKPFIPVNCGAIPTELVENEMFGHVRGAFTGASQSYSGLISEANGGTLFLDEIGSLPLQAQVKLLRFIQDKEYRQLGSSKLHQADVRIIAASNLDLEKAASEGKFRQDLFYRLNIIPIMMPPLRERKEDIPLLSGHFLEKYANEFDKQITEFSPNAMQQLMFYGWPGNVRELENIIERAVVFSKQAIIQDTDIFLPIFEAAEFPDSFKTAKAKNTAQFEKDYIQGLLLASQGNITQAAKAAQKNRRAFWELIKKHKIATSDNSICV
jgi:two-component system, NtrC family, response regulator GlrR